MTDHSFRGNGIDARRVAQEAKGRIARDTPTAEFYFIHSEKPSDNGGPVRVLRILHQVIVRPDGTKYLREIPTTSKAEFERRNGHVVNA